MIISEEEKSRIKQLHNIEVINEQFDFTSTSISKQQSAIFKEMKKLYYNDKTDYFNKLGDVEDVARTIAHLWKKKSEGAPYRWIVDTAKEEGVTLPEPKEINAQLQSLNGATSFLNMLKDKFCGNQCK